MLSLQFAVPTFQLPLDTDELSVPLRILAGFTVADPFPGIARLTFVHGWLATKGSYQVDLRIFDPSGRRIPMSKSQEMTLTSDSMQPTLAYTLNHINLSVEGPGRYEIEAIADGEVALRYPFYIWERGRVN